MALKNKGEAKGITLLALVITIILIIILSVVAINFAFGENGLVSKAQQGKQLHDIEYTREKLGAVLVDALLEKKLNAGYNQDDFLDDFIYEREPEAEATEDEISLNGHTFELDRSVPQLGEYIGEAGNLPPRIRKVEVTNKTLSQVSVEVTTARAEGITYRYSLKKNDELDSAYQGNVEQAQNTYIFTNLETLVIYNLRVEIIKDGAVVDTEVINVRLGELEDGSLTFGQETWSIGTASLPVSTTTTNQIQYQINGIEEGSWTTISGNSGNIPNVPNGATVFARLWDGSHGSEYISRMIEDIEEPKIEIQLEKAEGMANIAIKATVSQSDKESGINIEACKWVFNTSSSNNLSEEEYTEVFQSKNEELELIAEKEGTYYLHVLTVDNAGNVTEERTEAIKIEPFNMNYVKDGLIVWYDGTNNTGNGHSNNATKWKNLTSNKYDGVINGGAVWNSNYLQFDGVNDWVNMGIIKEPNITIETVISHDTGTKTYGVNNFQNGGLGFSDDYSKGYNALIININGYYQTISSKTNFLTNKIYSLSGKYDGDSADFFENGQKYSLARSGAISYNNDTVTVLGGNPAGSSCSGFVKEKIYSVRIYNRALTDDEILQNYEVDKTIFGISD